MVLRVIRYKFLVFGDWRDSTIPGNRGSVSSQALLTVSLPPSYRVSAGVPAGRGVGCRSRGRLWFHYHLPTTIYLSC